MFENIFLQFVFLALQKHVFSKIIESQYTCTCHVLVTYLNTQNKYDFS